MYLSVSQIVHSLLLVLYFVGDREVGGRKWEQSANVLYTDDPPFSSEIITKRSRASINHLTNIYSKLIRRNYEKQRRQFYNSLDIKESPLSAELDNKEYTLRSSRSSGAYLTHQLVTNSVEKTNEGENGAPVYLENPNPDETSLIDEGYRKQGFNEFVSNLIPVNRTLPDYRNAWCQKKQMYSKHQLQSSIIITFHNEAWSTLLRTIHSVLDRTPTTLLREIILVDDASTEDNLKERFEAYIRTLPKITLIRFQEREGLIKARGVGANNAAGPILTFLDSHVEVTEGWLEPLVDRITRNPTNVVAPIVDLIDPNTFEFRVSNKSATIVGSVLWNLEFRWMQASDEQLKSSNDYLSTPVLGSGMFSIHKNFFTKLGGFDEGFQLWGGENLEISLKAWMCGGRVEIAICSHIGHVLRKHSSDHSSTLEGSIRRNRIRIAAVWMDEFAPYHYTTLAHDLGDFGDITEQLQLKDNLECKPFRWYLSDVATNLFDPTTSIAHGEIRSLAHGGYICLDASSKAESFYDKVLAYPCHSVGGNQQWYYSILGELKRDELCLDYTGLGIIMYPCHGQGGNQRWYHDPKNGVIKHEVSEKCLALEKRDVLTMADCEMGTIVLVWSMEHFNNENNANMRLLQDNNSLLDPE